MYGARPASCPTSRLAKPSALKKLIYMRHIALITILLASCTTWKPNASLTGTVVEVTKDRPGKYTMKVKAGEDTVTVKYGGHRPKVNDRYRIDYDTNAPFPKQANIKHLKH